MFLHRKVAKHKATNSLQINSFNTIPVKISLVQFSRSVVSESVTPWTAAYQAPPSMGFSRQEYWSGVPLPLSHNNNTSKMYLCQEIKGII